MVTFAELRQAQPESYRSAARAWRVLADVITEQGVAVRDRSGELGWSWAGEAADAAVTHLARLAQEFGDGATLAGRIPGILDEHARRVAAAKARVDLVVDVLAGTPVRVSPAGAVSLSPLAYLMPATLPLWQWLAGQAQGLVDAAVRQATAADAETTGRLRQVLPAGNPATPTDPAAVPLSQIPRRGTDPRAVNRWWQGLTGQQRNWLLANHPELVGNLDGIPAVDRDRANRTVLAATKTGLEQRRDELKDRGDDRNDAEDDEFKRIKDELKGIDAIDDRLNDTGAGKQHPYLLGFDPRQGHAIVAMGNPDTATNVVTYVPGTGARLGTIGGDLGRADIMIDSARAAEPGESTAAIVWVGYDAPQDVINIDLGHLGEDATSDRYALGARDDLDRFQDGLRVTHEGARSHNTVLGHSYGSTVVGYTARDNGLDVDGVIFVGSPGVGVDHARDLHVPSEHVWSSTARNDPIQYGVDFGDLVRAGIGLDPHVDLVHGANPSSREFGGQVFHSDPGDPLLRWTWEGRGPGGFIPVPVPHFSAHAHSQYWDPGSASLENMGQIIVGNLPTRD